MHRRERSIIRGVGYSTGIDHNRKSIALRPISRNIQIDAINADETGRQSGPEYRIRAATDRHLNGVSRRRNRILGIRLSGGHRRIRWTESDAKQRYVVSRFDRTRRVTKTRSRGPDNVVRIHSRTERAGTTSAGMDQRALSIERSRQEASLLRTSFISARG